VTLHSVGLTKWFTLD
jgi:hypothetical protein